MTRRSLRRKITIGCLKVASHCKGIATASQPVENRYGTGDVSHCKCRLGVLFTLPNTERHASLTERRVACISNGSSVRVHICQAHSNLTGNNVSMYFLWRCAYGFTLATEFEIIWLHKRFYMLVLFTPLAGGF